MTGFVYVVRWYDYDWEETVIIGIYNTWNETASEIVDEFDGRFNYSELKEPEADSFWKWERRCIEIDNGEYGKSLIIEKVRVG